MFAARAYMRVPRLFEVEPTLGGTRAELALGNDSRRAGIK
jgi:hypothetical protein